MKLPRETVLAVLLGTAVVLLARAPLHVATFALPLSNDDAIPMIQAGLLLRGEATTTLINQPYNGTLDSWLMAPALWLAPAHHVFRAYEAVCGLMLVVACAWLAHRAAGRGAALAAALLAAFGTPYMALMTAVGPVPNFLVPLLVALAVALLWHELPGAAGARRGFTAGLVAGLACWDSALALPSLVGALGGLAAARFPGRAAALAFVPGCVIGLAPMAVARVIGAAGAAAVTDVRPSWLWREGLLALAHAAAGLFGVSVPLVVDGPERAALPALLAALLAAALAVLVVAGVARASLPLVGWGAALAGAFALSRRTGPDEIRYLYGLVVPVIVLAALGVERLRRRWGAAAYVAAAPLIVAWGVGHVTVWRHWRDPRHAAVVWQVPPLAPALTALEQAGIRSAYASLQFAGRLTLESGSRVIASQAWNERIPGDPLRFRDEVDLDPRAAWVLSPRWSRGMPRAAGFREAVAEMGGRAREQAAGDVVVFDRFEPPFDESRPVPAGDIQVTDVEGRVLAPPVLDRDAATTWTSPSGLSRGAGIVVRFEPARRVGAIALLVDVERSPLGVPWIATVDGTIVARGPRRWSLQWIGGVPRAGRQALLAIPLPGAPASEVRVVFQGAGPPLAVSELFAYGPDEALRPRAGENAGAAALDAARAGKWDEAVRLYEEASRAEPHRAEYHAAVVRARWRAAHRRHLDVESLGDGGEELLNLGR